jgi:outer membrane protein OmpA-like peptidoglycan-associated protein
MNRFIIPIVILLGSLLYSWFWNCYRKPECLGMMQPTAIEQTMMPAMADTTTIVEDTIQVELTPEEKVLFEPLDVYFESGKSTITRTNELENFLKTAKAYLEKNPDAKLSLTGHTDSDGSEATNNPLSLKRAGIVKNILVTDGFSPDNLETFGKGESEPIADESTPDGKAKNRRVSIRLMK